MKPQPVLPPVMLTPVIRMFLIVAALPNLPKDPR